MFLLRNIPLVALLWASLAVGAEAAMVRTVFDFQRSFDRATVNNAMQATAEGNARSGVFQGRALFEHPLAEGEASISYQVLLPQVPSGATLAFASYVGLRSGAPFNDQERPFDGVAFSLLVNAERRFREVVLGGDPHTVWADLTPLAGQRVTISLNTDCNGQSNWDWALWLRSRIVMVSEETRPAPCGEIVLFEARGKAGLDQDDPVQAVAGGQLLVEWWMPHSQLADGGWHLGMIEYAAPKDETPVEIVAGPGLEIRSVRRFSLPPEVEFDRISARQGIIWPGDQILLAAKVRNVGPSPLLPQDRCRVAVRLQGPASLQGPAEASIEKIDAGGEATVTWTVRTQQVADLRVQAELTSALSSPSLVHETISVLPKPAEAPLAVAEGRRIIPLGNDLLLESPTLRVQLVGDGTAYHYGLVFVAQGKTYKPLGALWPLSRVVYQGRDRPMTWVLRPDVVKCGAQSVDLEQTFTDERGAKWTASLRFQFAGRDPFLEPTWIETRYQLSVDRARNLLHFAGPTLLAGERCFGAKKDSALFPGLEALEGDEPSSSTRDFAPPLNLRYVPNLYKITIPLMAVSDGESTLGLMWDMNRHWSPGNAGLAARFASPNFMDAQDNHLMGVFVPTPPQWLTENEELASHPYVLEPDKPLTISAQILAAPGNAFASVWQWDWRHHLPNPLPWPRQVEQELALCRKGFMETVWDPETKKNRHCIDWGPANAPGFGTLLWWDSLVTRNQAARERAMFIGEQTLSESGPGGLWSTANCHIMRWEFPFYFGRLDEAFPALRDQAKGLLASQEADGSWRFHPGEGRESLGKAGDAVLGTCAGPAYNLWRYARLTGDPQAIAAGEKALRFMRRFRVPRGAQGWECPLYEPDILAAAYAILAYTEAYRATGNQEWLRDAEYWAESGLPFIYAWRLPDKPGMLHATIPVIGSTFYTHSWLGLPVQWCGLVYAYGLNHLADCPSSRSELWRKIAYGVTVSGAYQQFDFDDERAGTYPDSYNLWTGARNAAYINPEDIAVNLLALRGYDPDISTLLATGLPEGAAHVSSGARVRSAEITDGRLVARLQFFPGETTYSLIANVPEPQELKWEGRTLPRLNALADAEEGWAYRDGLLFVRERHQTQEGELEVTLPAPPS